MDRSRSGGFTLVELLVVITIIGVLIGLLLPAVQSAREAARAATCKNNVKQLAVACLLHENKHRHLPTGGWGPGWAGDPSRGFDHKQPGGWIYNILPYLDQEPLHRVGAAERVGYPLEMLICPTRRNVRTYPYFPTQPDNTYVNVSPSPKNVGRSDYAACAGTEGWPMPGSDGVYGSSYTSDVERGPQTLSAGDNMSNSGWEALHGTSDDADGVIFRRSRLPLGAVTDGESCTYLLGERMHHPDHYRSGTADFDSLGWDTGYDDDVIRWTFFAPQKDIRGRFNFMHANYRVCFGAAHSAGFHMALCDGSVHKINFIVDATIHHRLGSRNDGSSIDFDQIINP